jgi:hypothetical protein
VAQLTDKESRAALSKQYDQSMALVQMNSMVCTSRAGAAVPGVSDNLDKPETVQERVKFIEWEKIVDACSLEKGLPTSKKTNYPPLEDMKQCERDSKKEVPTANKFDRNRYIDSCLRAKGFDLPW